jgi:hypothetical protein
MSFEEKYNRYKKSEKSNVSEDYVNEMVGKVSDKISSKKPSVGIGIWIFSGVTVTALILILFVYPQFNSNPNISNPVSKDVTINPASKDSGTFASVPNKQNTKIENKELDQETIVEYLLDEEYEEI